MRQADNAIEYPKMLIIAMFLLFLSSLTKFLIFMVSISMVFIYGVNKETHRMRLYSYLNASTGFLVAACQLCQLTVNNATATAIAPAAKKTHQLRFVL